MALQSETDLYKSRHASRWTNTSDELLLKCWGHQWCWPCLREGPCSWCPVTSTCVPNPYRPQVLAPFYDADICPLWSERWEVRTQPLGCHVSTITIMTCVVSVVSTFVFVGLVAACFRLAKWARPKWKARTSDWWKVWLYYKRGWWKTWRLELRDKAPRRSAENDPLLG